MKRLLAILLATAGIAAHAQEAPDNPQGSGYAGPFDEKHVQQKRLDQIAIGLRVQRNLRIEADRKEVQYAENRRRCQAALRVAELCGKFAGTFYCDAKGFRSIAPALAARPKAMDHDARYKMQRCTLDAARPNPQGEPP